MKKRKKVIGVVILFVTLCLVGAGTLLFVYGSHGEYFKTRTTINGMSVSNKTPEEIAQILKSQNEKRKVEVVEKDKVILSFSYKEAGYEVQVDSLEQSISDYLAQQKQESWINTFKQENYNISIPYVMDETVFKQIVNSKQFTRQQIPTKDACLVFDQNSYMIEAEVYGNEIDENAFQNLVKKQMSETDLDDDKVLVIIEDDLYVKPVVTKENPDLQLQKDGYNQYCNARITYLFGNEQVVLEWDTIQQWLQIEKNQVSLDVGKISAYVTQMAEKYNTIYKDRIIETSGGKTITLAGNDYGYRIDKEGEINQLVSDLKENKEIEREPVYEIKGYGRNGVDDLNGTYIEVDLTNQHLWLYINHELIVESDVVTGNPDYQETEWPVGM
ncbi:MAG: peptidoglycan binding domain-containing protein [Lachnospiraceae bacterium]|nr:peptidoglycan binding domain-containing protein [Lachnospiraceae bacterium]MDD3616339.1 peptidoglycan binding domain-containing protein [Lachnospiraceae bacterium]